MINSGIELTDFITALNGGATIDADLLDILVGNAQAIIEEERPWVVLRKTDTSKSINTGSTWQTAIDLSTITDFSRFYSDTPLILFDGNNKREYYILRPFDRRLEYKDTSNTAVYDENTKTLYLNGVIAYSGTLNINYVSTSTSIDLTNESAVWSLFPTRFLPIVGYYAIGIHKGAVDYDSINKLMLPTNRETFLALREAMESWDNQKQQDSLSFNDPADGFAGNNVRFGAVDRFNDLI